MPADPTPITDFEYPDAKRKNLPPAGSPPGERVAEEPKVKFAYDPHRPPVLRFNERITRCRELLEKSTRDRLTKDDAAELAAHLESEQPWLEWAGKREQPHFEVEPVALHLHERVSAQAILRAVRREDAQRDFFAEPKLPAREARAYYQHDVDWANRLILGDSLQVMTSLARREGLAGQVQMIYFDPPYGIKFSSNWQNEVGKRDVKDKDEDLTREPEMIRAYRDTWTLGVHSYLAYLKQRLLLARELLTDSGSIFVQISDENLHRVRAVMDEVFGAENFCRQIIFLKTTGKGGELLDNTYDALLWYSKDAEQRKYRPTYELRLPAEDSNLRFVELPNGITRQLTESEIANPETLAEGARVFRPNPLTNQRAAQGTDLRDYTFRGCRFTPGAGTFRTDKNGLDRLAAAERLLPAGQTLTSVRYLDDFPCKPRNDIWDDTRQSGFADSKVYVVQTGIRVIERCMLMTTEPGDLVLDPTCGSGTTAFVAEQWGRRWITVDSSRVAAAIARHRLLTASFETYKTRDPQAGVDPNQPLNPRHGFIYKSVPHITLKSIAQNKGLDPIFARHEPILAARLAALNAALASVTDALRQTLTGKLIKKLRDDGARTVTDADQRRWLLPGTDPALIPIQKGGPTASQAKALRDAIPTAWMREDGSRFQRSSHSEREPGALPQAGIEAAPLARRSAITTPAAATSAGGPSAGGPSAGGASAGGMPSAKGANPYQPGATPQDSPANRTSAESAAQPAWAKWEVPFDTDPDWPTPLREALTAYRAAWRAKMDEVNAGISANAEQEELVDQPESVRGVVRVSGPFTVESIRPPENGPEPETPIGGAPEELETFDVEAKAIASGNAGSHIDRMLDLLRHDGITFLGNKHVKVDPLQRIESSFLHAEGEFVSADDGKTHRVAVVIGPELGSVPGFLVEQAMRHCYKRGYDDLVVAGFSFDAMAQEAIQDNNDDKNTDLRIHMAQIRPDVTMGDLLKKTQVSAQIFTVFGQPRTRLSPAGGDEWQVHMDGVDIYDPVKNSIEATNAGKVAAWFVDTDYDGKVFCICQAFFPDKSAWEKLARALKGSIEEGAFDKLSGTTSLPFKPGERQTVAVKVIDPRGNEVMRVHRLGAVKYEAGE